MEEPILRSLTWQIDPPALFGAFHMLASAAVTAAAVLLAVLVSGRVRTDISGRHAAQLTAAPPVRLLAACGWILILLECAKQLFLIRFVMDGSYDWWYFPFQLCSVPMYLCVILPLTRGGIQDAVLTFLSSYTVLGAAAALIYPEDMLRSYVFLTAHGFIWHGLLLFIGLTSMLTYTRAGSCSDQAGPGSFLRATLLFLFMCAAAVIINLKCPGACMFYLDPLSFSPQPLVAEVQQAISIPAGLALYALSVILGAMVIFYAGKARRER